MRTRVLLSGFVVVMFSSAGSTNPPAEVPLAKAVERADYVGVVEIADAPVGKKFKANAPPVVTAKPVAVLKGDAKDSVKFAWQTFCAVCKPLDPATVEVLPPAVGERYMVFLVKDKDGALVRMDYQWHFHKIPAAPTVRVQPSHDNAWRGVIEVTPPVAGPGEAVKYRFTRTRLAEKAWEGNDSNVIAEDIDVIDFTRKQVMERKKPGERKTADTVVAKGETVVDVIDLTEAFGITRPGEYWVFRGGAFEGNAPLRFEVSDKVRKR